MDLSHGLRTPKESFFQKFETFGRGQTNWAEMFWGIWGIFGQTTSTILALWVTCPWKNVVGSFFYKKIWFLGLKHITLKYSQNKILAVKNLGNSVQTSIFGDQNGLELNKLKKMKTKKRPTVSKTIFLYHKIQNEISYISWLQCGPCMCHVRPRMRFSTEFFTRAVGTASNRCFSIVILRVEPKSL